MGNNKRIIKKEEYLVRLSQGIPIGDCWVDLGNGELAYALHEVVVTGVEYTKYKDKTFIEYDVCALISDNTRTNIKQSNVNVDEVNYAMNQQIEKNHIRIEDNQIVMDENEDNQVKSKEKVPSSEYTLRDNNINYKELLSEFLHGTGPERSLFLDGHPMVESLKTSWILTLARIRFLSTNSRSKYFDNVPFGLAGAAFSGTNMVGQFIGGARVTIVDLGRGVYYQVDDTKDRNSLYYHSTNVNPIRRKGEIILESTTYQRYIWIEKKY
jgi:hypothetical protein